MAVEGGLVAGGSVDAEVEVGGVASRLGGEFVESLPALRDRLGSFDRHPAVAVLDNVAQSTVVPDRAGDTGAIITRPSGKMSEIESEKPARFWPVLPLSAATSANRSAYVGVQQMTVGASVSTSASLASLDMPPAGMQCASIWQPASNAVQNPRNGPNEKGNRMRSRAPTPAAR